MLNRCVHEWTKLDKEVFPSISQQVDDKDMFFVEFPGAGEHEFKQSYILVLICDKCGKVKKIREWSLL